MGDLQILLPEPLYTAYLLDLCFREVEEGRGMPCQSVVGKIIIETTIVSAQSVN